MSNTPEKDKYLAWHKKATEEDGLVSLSVTSEKALANFLGEEYTKNITSEEVYRELNEINDAIAEGKCEVIAEVGPDGVWIKDSGLF